jgi:hypothetical protein
MEIHSHLWRSINLKYWSLTKLYRIYRKQEKYDKKCQQVQKIVTRNHFPMFAGATASAQAPTGLLHQPLHGRQG